MRPPDNPIRVMFAGGGTGGHFYPALQLAEGVRNYAKKYALGEPQIAFFGHPDKIEGRHLRDKETFYPLSVQGFHRGSLVDMIKRNMAFPVKLLKSYSYSKSTILEFEPYVLVGTGGYVSGPPLYAGSRLNIPLIIQEQNSYPGITTRILAKYAEEIHVNYMETVDILGKDKRIVHSGNPVRALKMDMDQGAAKRELGLPDDRKLILLIGGSQGAEPINRHIAGNLQWYKEEEDLAFIWQCGEKNYQKYKQLSDRSSGIIIKGFIEEMAPAYSAADVVVARAGALTISELAAAGKPAILIPLPSAAANHQHHNAVSYAKAGAAFVVRQKELPEGTLEETLQKIIDSPALMAEMGSKALELARPNATKSIVESIYRIAGIKKHVSKV